MATAAEATPTTKKQRITNLDAVRGFATLGILVMNAVSFGLPTAAYFNLDAAGSNSWLDWVVGVAGEIFIDQKTMAIFSMLFGAGIVLFADRAEAKGRRPVWFSLWRNFLLLLIGVAHAAVWDGDVLTLYAICSPFLLMLRKRSPRALIIVGTAMVLSTTVVAAIAQGQIPASGDGLGEYWFIGQGDMGDATGLFFIYNFGFRALGMMLIGVALFRLDILQGTRPSAFYRRMVVLGLGVGLPLAVGGVIWQIAADFSPDIAFIGDAPNTFATIPLSMAYVGLVTLWNQRRQTAAHERIRAVGRMALTNYLMQTVLGLAILGVFTDKEDGSRAVVFVAILVIWAIQIAWSKPWLTRFRFGPFEWLWRCATYSSWQPLRVRASG